MIIGLAGYKRSGKNTAADYLVRQFYFTEKSFAHKMRVFVADLLGWTLSELEVRKEEPVPWLGGKTARQMLQTLGTEWGREMVHSELWVRSTLNQCVENKDYVISDVRFPNEAEGIHQRGGKIIRLVGRGETGDSHASETPLPAHLVDYEVNNSGHVNLLYDDLCYLVQVVASGDF